MIFCDFFGEFFMYLTYLFICGLLSLSITGLLIIAAVRTGRRRREDFFSASLGIIIFVCVKSIVTDCGWGFAALFGIPHGPVAQLCLTFGAFFFFRTLRCTGGTDALEFGNHFTENASLLCFAIGRNLLCDDTTVANLSLYLLGEAAELALMTTAVQLINGEETPPKVPIVMERAAMLIGIKTVICTILRQQAGQQREFSGVVLITIGLTGLVCEFVDAISPGREIKPGGFAAGFTAALCMTALFG